MARVLTCRSTLGGDVVRSTRIITQSLGAAPRIYYRCGDFTGGRRSQPDDESDEDLCRNWWEVIKEDVVEFNQGWLHNLRNVITSVIEHNRFFLTHRGFMGIGGSGISTGDRVFVLRGDQPPSYYTIWGKRSTAEKAAITPVSSWSGQATCME